MIGDRTCLHTGPFWVSMKSNGVKPRPAPESGAVLLRASHDAGLDSGPRPSGPILRCGGLQKSSLCILNENTLLIPI